jgi:hypothetical protein
VGDRVEQWLSKMGVTPESYAHAKEAIGLIPDCNCPKRKQAMNEVHAYAKEHGWLKAIAHAREIAKRVTE